MQTEPEPRGRVVAVGGGLVAVRLDGGEPRVAMLAGRLTARPVVGDLVDVSEEGDELRVDVIAPRRTTLQRLMISVGRSRGDQTLVANADLLVIVAALAEPPLRRGLVDRLLVAAWAGGMDAALVVTKADRADVAEEPLEGILESYRDAGFAAISIDARTAAGARAVREVIGDRVAVLVGHSGVGKSTLVNGLVGGKPQVTGAVREVNQRGRHTTTAARWLDLPDGGSVIDTPGLRLFALTGVDPEDVAAAFPEIAAAAPRCRFADCAHVGEAGCAVPEAIASARLDSYRVLRAEVAAST